MDRTCLRALGLAAVFLLLGSSGALAVVDMRIANYSDSWTVLRHPLDGEPAVEIEVSYNSRSLFQGIFGFGWCSDLETRLDLERREQVIQLKWCGDGGVYLFFPAGNSGSNQRRYKAQDGRAELLVSGDLLEVRYLGEGGCGCSGLFASAQVFRFNREGRLREVLYREGRRHVYSYRLGLLESVSTGGGTVRLEYGSDGRVARVVAPDGRASEHRYSIDGDQISFKSGWGNKYFVEYDELHNLVRILYPDGSDKRLTYDRERDCVTSFQNRDKCVERYRYEFSRLDSSNYWALVEKRCGPEEDAQARFEFWYRPNPSGSGKYLYRTRTILKEDVLDIEYDDRQRKISETRNGRRTRYRYAEDGSVKEIAAPPAEP